MPPKQRQIHQRLNVAGKLKIMILKNAEIKALSIFLKGSTSYSLCKHQNQPIITDLAAQIYIVDISLQFAQ